MIIGCFNEKNGDVTINDGFMGDSWVFDGDISYFWGCHGILHERKITCNLNHPWS